MFPRAADDFAAIRTRLQELRRAPAEAVAREDTGAKPYAAEERYPRHLMEAVKRLLHELARRG